jgi:hypothetical protein
LIINRFKTCRWYQSMGSEDMMAMSDVSKNRHGVYYVVKRCRSGWGSHRRVLNNGKSRQIFLKRSLDTKDLREANIRAKPVLIAFDRIPAQAEGLNVQRPMRTTSEKREIEQITDHFFAHQLAIDDEDRREGRPDPLFQGVAQQLSASSLQSSLRPS